MDNLETPYNEEDQFLECAVCDKSIRGENFYRIHLTTPGHLKKEDALVAAGQAVRRQTVPDFQDITQYLDYLKLDEPIIGLNYLEEKPCHEGQVGLRYLCRLCHLTANLGEMVHHVIGRKHRQKYVELKRPDLVTWETLSLAAQAGKIMRARAEIIERQDGRGCPKALSKKAVLGDLNISRVAPKQNQTMGKMQPQIQRDVPPLLPELKNYQAGSSHRRKYPDYSNTKAFHPDEPSMKRDRRHQWEDTLSHDNTKEELQRADYRETSTYKEDYMDLDHRSQYNETYVDRPHRSTLNDSGDIPRYDYREDMVYGQAQRTEYHTGEAPSPHRRPYPDRDPLNEFYSEEVKHSAEFQRSKLEDDKQRWSLERETGKYDSMNRAGRQGSSEPEAKRRNFSTPLESDRSNEYLFNIIKEYRHGMTEPYQETAFDQPGPSRAEGPASQRPMGFTRTIANIPAPFRRFLEGATGDGGHRKRKKKSRFSDATPEEIEMTKQMFGDEYGPRNPKTFGGDPRADDGEPYSDFYRGSQSPHQNQRFQGRGSESEGVFDLLDNIEIENAEEAHFLKNKLCSLLKEFKTKKLEKATQNSQSRGGFSRNHSDLNLDPQLRQHEYEGTLREDFDHRLPENRRFKDDHRRGWMPREQITEEGHQEYHRPGHEELRSGYEDMFGTRHTNRLDEPSDYRKRFQEPMRASDYQPAAEEFFGSHSPAPSFHMERGPRMHRERQYSNSLDKITSTLLELVARK